MTARTPARNSRLGLVLGIPCLECLGPMLGLMLGPMVPATHGQMSASLGWAAPES